MTVVQVALGTWHLVVSTGNHWWCSSSRETVFSCWSTHPLTMVLHFGTFTRYCAQSFWILCTSIISLLLNKLNKSITSLLGTSIGVYGSHIYISKCSYSNRKKSHMKFQLKQLLRKCHDREKQRPLPASRSQFQVSSSRQRCSWRWCNLKHLKVTCSNCCSQNPTNSRMNEENVRKRHAWSIDVEPCRVTLGKGLVVCGGNVRGKQALAGIHPPCEGGEIMYFEFTYTWSWSNVQMQKQ